jgi:hypothetical protein
MTNPFKARPSSDTGDTEIGVDPDMVDLKKFNQKYPALDDLADRFANESLDGSTASDTVPSSHSGTPSTTIPSSATDPGKISTAYRTGRQRPPSSTRSSCEPPASVHNLQQASNVSATTLEPYEARLQKTESALQRLMAQMERLHQLDEARASLEDLTMRLADLERKEQECSTWRGQRSRGTWWDTVTDFVSRPFRAG